MPYLVPPVVPAGRMANRPQPSVPAGDLLLRPWDGGDIGTQRRAYADAEIRRWHARTVASDEEARALLDAWNAGWVAETRALGRGRRRQ